MQYTSKAFVEFCKSVHITQSMGKAGYPYDNASGRLMALSFLLLFHAVRQCVRKIRKVNCVAEKEQAYPLVPFLLLGVVISIFGLY